MLVFNVTDQVRAGTGLGLAIALAVAEAHGGRVIVESAPGEGASFVIWLAEHRKRGR